MQKLLTPHGALLASFSLVSAFCAYRLLASVRAAPPARAAPPPRLPHEALLSLLRELRAVAEAEGRAAAAALDLARAEGGDPASLEALRSHARARVQAALGSAQASAFSARGLSEKDAERALEYFTAGSGRSDAIVAAARDIKAAAGEWLLSQARMLELFRAFFEERARALQEAAQRAVQEGRSREEAPAVLRDAQAQSLAAGKALLLEESGVTFDRLREIAESPAYAQVRPFSPPLAAHTMRIMFVPFSCPPPHHHPALPYP